MVNRITTMNPTFCIAMALLSLLGALAEITSKTELIAFTLGAAAAVPLIFLVWETMKSNWPVYRKFYSMTFYQRDTATILKSWKLTWWITPYIIIFYGLLDMLILVKPLYGTVPLLLFGATFVIFSYTAFEAPRYYRDLLSRR